MTIEKTLGRLVPTEEAAEILGIATKTVIKWRGEGTGPRFTKMGSRVLYSTRELACFIEANTFNSTDEVRAREAGVA